MVPLEDRLDVFRKVLEHVFHHARHLRVEAYLLVSAVQLLVQLLFVKLWLLGLGLLFIDFHLDVVVVELDVLLDHLLEVAHHGLHFMRQLQLEVGLQVGQVDEVVLRLTVRRLQVHFQLVFNHRASLFKLSLLTILLAEEVVPF